VDSPHTLVQASRRREHAREPPQEEPARTRIVARGEGLATDELALERYRLLEQLGSGGFGVVWRAHDELLHREVAVKRIWLGAGEGTIDSERASREAHATARLSHPAIVALHEACARDGAFYLISELVDGDTLACLIAEDALEDEEILEIAVALSGALSHAHARGVIHRDIKPQNVLVPHPLAEGGDVPQTMVAAAKLTDFGGASLVGEEALTRTGDVLGTLAYMAPEQSEGREVGEQADLYSLALVIYEALCGVNPVRGATPAATVRRIGRPLPSMQRERRDLPPTLTRALDRALHADPRARGTLDDLRGALEESLARGLRRSRWRRVRATGAHASTAVQGLPAAAPREPHPAHEAPRAFAHRPAPAYAAEEDLLERDAPEHRRGLSSPNIPLPRAVWLVATGVLVAWQSLAGRPGLALLALAALVPLLIACGERGASRLGAGWLACVLAPALGLIGLAGAFPAIAGQATRWRERAALGALGYWWLVLAEPLLGRNLWLGVPAGTPARGVWERSIAAAADHAISPLLVLGVLLGALLWGVGATLLPWVVRGRSAVLDVVAVTVWSAAIAASAPVLDAGLSSHVAHPNPRGAVLGAIAGALVAVASRALRGPV
jgi:hypothetical protein